MARLEACVKKSKHAPLVDHKPVGSTESTGVLKAARCGAAGSLVSSCEYNTRTSMCSSVASVSVTVLVTIRLVELDCRSSSRRCSPSRLVEVDLEVVDVVVVVVVVVAAAAAAVVAVVVVVVVVVAVVAVVAVVVVVVVVRSRSSSSRSSSSSSCSSSKSK